MKSQLRTYYCDGAETSAKSPRAAAEAFANLAAFDAYGEDGVASPLFIIKRHTTFDANIGVVRSSGKIEGRVVALRVEEV